ARTDCVDSSFVADESSLDAVFMELAGEPNTDDLHEGESALDRAREALADGRLADAGAAATAALAAGGSTADALVISGQVFSALGLDGEALERFRSALATDSTRLDARVGESRTLVRLGRAEEARQSLGALVAEHPGDTDILMLAAEMHSAAGEHAGAVKLIRAARSAAPTRADVLHQLGRSLGAQGDVEGAIGALRAALGLDS